MESLDTAEDDTEVVVGTLARIERLEVLLDLDRALSDAANRFSLAAQLVHRRDMHSLEYL